MTHSGVLQFPVIPNSWLAGSGSGVINEGLAELKKTNVILVIKTITIREILNTN